MSACHSHTEDVFSELMYFSFRLSLLTLLIIAFFDIYASPQEASRHCHRYGIALPAPAVTLFFHAAFQRFFHIELIFSRAASLLIFQPFSAADR
jgi:hypothetical protein